MEARVSVVGLDIAKSVFQVHAADNSGRPVIRRKLKREGVESFFRALAPCLVGLEACPGSHFWARLLRDMGHDVRLLPAQYVKPYVKTNKNDAADAEAICEAVTRPTMRFVPIKEEMQQEVLVIQRVREMLIRQRTQLINGIRGHLAEFGIIGPNRSHKIGLLTKLIEDPDCDELPAVARHALQYLPASRSQCQTFQDRSRLDCRREEQQCLPALDEHSRRRCHHRHRIGFLDERAHGFQVGPPLRGLVGISSATTFDWRQGEPRWDQQVREWLSAKIAHPRQSLNHALERSFLDLASKSERQKTCQRCGSRDRQQDSTCRLGLAPIWWDLQPPNPAGGNEYGMILEFGHRWSKRLRG